MVFIEYPLSQFKHSCTYNDTSGLKAVYNFSWYVEGGVLGRFFQDVTGFWIVDIECYNSNETKVVNL